MAKRKKPSQRKADPPPDDACEPALLTPRRMAGEMERIVVEISRYQLRLRRLGAYCDSQAFAALAEALGNVVDELGELSGRVLIGDVRITAGRDEAAGRDRYPLLERAVDQVANLATSGPKCELCTRDMLWPYQVCKPSCPNGQVVNIATSDVPWESIDLFDLKLPDDATYSLRGVGCKTAGEADRWLDTEQARGAGGIGSAVRYSTVKYLRECLDKLRPPKAPETPQDGPEPAEASTPGVEPVKPTGAKRGTVPPSSEEMARSIEEKRLEADRIGAAFLAGDEDAKRVVYENLRGALGTFQNADDRWARLRKSGASDATLKKEIGEAFGLEGSSSGPGRIGYGYKGGKDPRFMLGMAYGKGAKPLLRGKALLAHARELLGIPLPKFQEGAIRIVPTTAAPEPAPDIDDDQVEDLMAVEQWDVFDGDKLLGQVDGIDETQATARAAAAWPKLNLMKARFELRVARTVTADSDADARPDDEKWESIDVEDLELPLPLADNLRRHNLDTAGQLDEWLNTPLDDEERKTWKTFWGPEVFELLRDTVASVREVFGWPAIPTATVDDEPSVDWKTIAIQERLPEKIATMLDVLNIQTAERAANWVVEVEKMSDGEASRATGFREADRAFAITHIRAALEAIRPESDPQPPAPKPKGAKGAKKRTPFDLMMPGGGR